MPNLLSEFLFGAKKSKKLVKRRSPAAKKRTPVKKHSPKKHSPKKAHTHKKKGGDCSAPLQF